MPDTQHAGQVIGDLILSLVCTVHMVDEPVERLYYRTHIDIILRVHAFGQFVCHVAIDILTSCDQILFYASQRVMLLDLQVNNLVWYDGHSLQ